MNCKNRLWWIPKQNQKQRGQLWKFNQIILKLKLNFKAINRDIIVWYWSKITLFHCQKKVHSWDSSCFCQSDYLSQFLGIFVVFVVCCFWKSLNAKVCWISESNDPFFPFCEEPKTPTENCHIKSALCRHQIQIRNALEWDKKKKEFQVNQFGK